MASLAEVNQTLQATNDNVITGDSMIVQAVDRLNNTMSSMVKMMQIQNLKLLEALREKGPAQTAPAAKDAGPAKPDSNLGMILAGIAAFLMGFLSGLADSFRKIFALTKFDKVIAGIGRIIDSITDFMRTRFTKLLDAVKTGPLGKLVDGVKTNFTEIFDFLKNSTFGRILGAIKNILLGPFEGLFLAEGAGNVFTRIKNAVLSPFQKVADTIKTIFSFADEGSKLMTILGRIGTVLGKLFFPFTVIMTIYDTVKEAISGFEEGGILGGLAGAITGLLNSIVGMPLDLLKSAVSFILGKLGFEQAEEALDSFSFQDIIRKVIFSFVDFLKGVVNGIIEGVATLVENLPLVPDSVGDKIRSLKFDTSTSDETTTPVDMEAPEQQAVSGSFMDESAGMDPVAPIAAPAAEEDPGKEGRAAYFQRKLARQERRKAQLDRQQQGGGSVVSAPTSIVNNNSSNNSQSMIAPMATPFDRKDPAMQTALGMLN